MVLTRVLLHPHDHVPVHLHKPPIAVPREPFIVAVGGQSQDGQIVESQVEDRVHHPGHRVARAGADRHQQRFLHIAEFFAEGRQIVGIERARIAFEIAPDLGHWGVEIAGKVKAWAKALIGPTSNPGKYPQLMNAPGSETGPGPQLVTWGKSTVCSVDAFGYNFSWKTNSSKHIPFDWAGP